MEKSRPSKCQQAIYTTTQPLPYKMFCQTVNSTLVSRVPLLLIAKPCLHHSLSQRHAQMSPVVLPCLERFLSCHNQKAASTDISMLVTILQSTIRGSRRIVEVGKEHSKAMQNCFIQLPLWVFPRMLLCASH